MADHYKTPTAHALLPPQNLHAWVAKNDLVRFKRYFTKYLRTGTGGKRPKSKWRSIA